MGCGSASIAALEVFGNQQQQPIQWIHGIDPSHAMRACAQDLLDTYLEHTQQETETANNNNNKTLPLPKPRVTFSKSLSAEPSSSSSSSTTGRFDLILCTYTTTELVYIGSTLAAAALLCDKLSVNGILVFIEPRTPDGFNSLRSIRNMLLDCCPPTNNNERTLKDDNDDDEEEEYQPDEVCHIVAPCTHNGPCPMVRHKKHYKYKKKQQQQHQVDVVEEEWSDDEQTTSVVMDQNDDEEEDSLDWSSDEEEDDKNDDDNIIEVSSHHGLLSETDLFDSSFCSFVQTLPGSSRRSKGEKFSYLVVQKRLRNSEEVDNNNAADNVDDVSHLLARAHEAAAQNDSDDVDPTQWNVFQEAIAMEDRYLELPPEEDDDLGLELLRGDAQRSKFGRIIRAQRKKRGHVYIEYCAAPGRIIRSRITKKKSMAVAPGMFAAVRKSRWVGLWPDIMDRIYSSNDKKNNKT